MKNYFVFIGILFISLNLFSQHKIAVVRDTDGYVNVRKEQSATSGILGTIQSGQFVFVDTTDGDWVKILYQSQKPYYSETGYIHKSRVIRFQDLPVDSQKQIITVVFKNYISYAERFYSGYEDHVGLDSLNKLRSDVEFHYESDYLPVLYVLKDYIGLTYDAEVFTLFLETINHDRGSADESRYWTLCDCLTLPKYKIKSLIDQLSPELQDMVRSEAGTCLEANFSVNDPQYKTIVELIELLGE